MEPDGFFSFGLVRPACKFVQSGPVEIRWVYFWGETGKSLLLSGLVQSGSNSEIQSTLLIHMSFYKYFLHIFTFPSRISNNGYCIPTRKAKKIVFVQENTEIWVSISISWTGENLDSSGPIPALIFTAGKRLFFLHKYETWFPLLYLCIP